MPINESLPFFEIPTEKVRSDSDVFARLMILHVVAACAYGFDRIKAKEWINQEGLGMNLTAAEAAFVNTGVGNTEQFKVQVEGMWALSWALGLVPRLDFSKGCDNQFALLLPNLKVLQPATLLRSKVNRPSFSEVVEACDLAYCLHWGIQQVRLTGEAMPSKVVPYVVIERRRALEWLICDDDWDSLSLDT